MKRLFEVTIERTQLHRLKLSVWAEDEDDAIDLAHIDIDEGDPPWGEAFHTDTEVEDVQRVELDEQELHDAQERLRCNWQPSNLKDRGRT